MVKSTKQQDLIGSVVAIPLPDKRFAYARIFQGMDLGIYDLISNNQISIDEVIEHPIAFYQACNLDAIRCGQWPVIGREPFRDDVDAWAPPQATCYVRSAKVWTMGGVPQISYKGETLPATFEQVRGLDILSVCHRPELLYPIIVDRVVNRNDQRYKVV